MRDPFLNIRSYSRRMTIDMLLAYHGRTKENAAKFNEMSEEELSAAYKEMTE